jgi:hypothetical protein
MVHAKPFPRRERPRGAGLASAAASLTCHARFAGVRRTRGPGPALAGQPRRRSSSVRRMGQQGNAGRLWARHAPPAGLRWKMAAGLTATLRGNPIEHCNIRVIESSGQARNAATGLRYHNLRTRDNRGNARDSGAITARDRPQFSYSINTGHGFSLRQNAMSGGCAGNWFATPLTFCSLA